MADNLFSFVYRTLCTRANNPANRRFFIPDRLKEADDGSGGRLLPKTGDDWEVGEIQGEGGQTIRNTIAQSWWSLAVRQARKADPSFVPANFLAIPTPAAPWPLLRMPRVTVDGLFNVWLSPVPPVQQPGNGYRATLTLQFGYYAGQDGLPSLPQVRISGRYELRQSVCAARKSASSQCVAGYPLSLPNLSWPTDDITGSGNVAVDLTGMFADADVEISVAPDRTLSVLVQNVTVRGAAPGSVPTIVMDPDALTIDSGVSEFLVDAWKTSVMNAFSNPVTHRALTANLNAMLNEPANRGRLAEMLQAQLGSVLDDVLGAAPALPSGDGQQAANPVDQYLFDRMRVSMSTPGTPYFVPRVVAASRDPVLEPLLIDEIRLGDHQIDPGLPPLADLRLQGVRVAGASNVAAPMDQMLLRGGRVDATLLLSTLDPPPRVTVNRDGVPTDFTVPGPPLRVTGQFSMASPEGGDRLGGGFSLDVSRSTVAASMRLSGAELDSLRVEFSALSLQALPADSRVSLQLDSAFADLIQGVLNQDDVKAQVLEAIDDQARSALAAVSDQASTAVRRIVAAELDGG